MAKKEKFPKQIFVGINFEAGDESFLVADESPEGISVQNEEREVGIYSLVPVATLKNKTSVE